MTTTPTDLGTMLAGFRQAVRGVPFPTVIRALADVDVLPIDPTDADDRKLIETISAAASRVAALVKADPIRRNRPNEVGNDIEPFVMQALAEMGLRVERPKSANGRGQLSGYPDVLIFDVKNRPTYLECKIFDESAEMTTMRSFYLSPSANPKVCLDARHLLLAFGVRRRTIDASPDSFYHPTFFKLVDLFGLTCDVKYEFNANNARLYKPQMMLADGKL